MHNKHKQDSLNETMSLHTPIIRLISKHVCAVTKKQEIC